MATATLYWLHLPNETNIFTDGYVGVTPNFEKRMREHKHRFKSIWHKVIYEKVIIATNEYCYQIEKKLRPLRNIGWNMAIGGFRNGTMLGQDNPNFGKFGELASNFKGWWITPMGKFSTADEAASANGLKQCDVIRRCKGRFANNKFYQPKDGWAFKPKA
jgi:hypothetical protein